MPKVLNHVKEDIQFHTRSLLKAVGYAQINIRLIASECGIGMGTIYNYYKSKDAILYDVIMRDWVLKLEQIDLSQKKDLDPMIQLKLIFTSIREFTNFYRGTWIDMMMSGRQETNCPAQADKAGYRAQIAQRIGTALRHLSEKVSPDEFEFMCDLLARSFFSYANDQDFDEAKLHRFLERSFSSPLT